MIQQRDLAYITPAEDEPVHTVSVGEIRLITMVVGGLIGAGIAATSFDPSDRNKWLIFTLIATLLGVAAGESFGFGLSRWAEVRQYHVIKLWRVWLSVIVVLALAAGLIASTPYLFGDARNLTQNGILLSALAILGGLSSALTLAAIKQVVSDPLPGSPGQQLDALLRLRRMSSRMLSQLGVLVLFVMAVNWASLGWGSLQNPNVPIFSGVVASLVVAMIYVPTASSLRRRGAMYVERYFSLTNVPLGTLVTAAEDRSKLEKMLSLDQTTFGELRAGLVVLTPVVAGVIASLVQNL